MRYINLHLHYITFTTSGQETEPYSYKPEPDDAEDKFFHMILNDAVMFYHCFCLSAAMNLHILFVHAGMTGHYHNEPLDSLITVLLHGSFLRIVISIYSLHFHLRIIMRLVMCIKRICYVMLTSKTESYEVITTVRRCQPAKCCAIM